MNKPVTAKCRLIGITLFVATLGACSVKPSIETKALLIQTSESIRQEITLAVTDLLKGKPVTLAPDAFMKTSRLLIERKAHLDKQGLPIQGRSLEIPEAFILVKQGKTCLIKHEKSQQVITLSNVKCKPETP